MRSRHMCVVCVPKVSQNIVNIYKTTEREWGETAGARRMKTDFQSVGRVFILPHRMHRAPVVRVGCRYRAIHSHTQKSTIHIYRYNVNVWPAFELCLTWVQFCIGKSKYQICNIIIISSMAEGKYIYIPFIYTIHKPTGVCMVGYIIHIYILLEKITWTLKVYFDEQEKCVNIDSSISID